LLVTMEKHAGAQVRQCEIYRPYNVMINSLRGDFRITESNRHRTFHETTRLSPSNTRSRTCCKVAMALCGRC